MVLNKEIIQKIVEETVDKIVSFHKINERKEIVIS